MTESAGPKGAGLGALAARSAFVTMLGQVARIVIQLVSVIILARLLSPHDYGLLAMVMAVVAVADVFRDFGLSSAAVQAKTLSSHERDNLFWLNAGIGVILVIVICAASPLLALFFRQSELTLITCGIAVTFLLSGLATQYRADLQRRLLFRRLTVADVTSPLIALVVAVVLALAGAGYWALVAQQVVQGLVNLIMIVIAARWLPGRYHRGVPMRRFLKFGGHLAGGQLIHYLGANFDALLIGARFGADPLGLYNRGFQLLMRPLGQLRAPMTSVALPVLSRLNDDEDRYGEYLRVGQRAMGYTLVLGLGLVLGAGDPIVAIFLGDQWGGVAPIMRWLALCGIFETLAFVGYWTYVSKGLVRQLLHFTIMSTAIKIVGISIGSVWGVEGVAAGFAIAEVASWPLSFAWLRRSSGVDVRPLITGGLRIVAVSLTIAGASWLVTRQLAEVADWLQLLAAIGAAAVIAAVSLAIPAVRRDVGTVLAAARSGLVRR
jgi:PST family polysaccharide transporter